MSLSYTCLFNTRKLNVISEMWSSSNQSLSAESNLSCFLYGPGDARFEEKPVPSIGHDSHDVLLRIAYTGVCGSDVCTSSVDWCWSKH